MTSPRIYPRTSTEVDAQAFHLGFETYRYDEVGPWGQYRVFCIHLGFWRIEWTT